MTISPFVAAPGGGATACPPPSPRRDGVRGPLIQVLGQVVGLFLVFLIPCPDLAAEDVYQTPEAFLADTFGGDVPNTNRP